MFLNLLLVLCLVCLNGLLAMSELAVVAARRARLEADAARGQRGARIALRLAEDRGRFLSTVQVGITLVGVLAGAVSGATIGVRLADVLPRLGVPAQFADELGVGLVVIIITYLSLVIGELVPKQIALAAPEKVAARVAPAMLILSRIAAPVVWVLDSSGRLVLRLLGQSDRQETPISDEDIHYMLSEAAGAGVIHRAEKDLIGGVMRFSDRRARALMTPRPDVEIAESGESLSATLARFSDSGHSRLPLRSGGPDEIIGLLHSRDVLAAPAGDFDAEALVRPAPVIPESLPALKVVEQLRQSPGHMLLVYDEHGRFKGIVTAMDLLGAIAGGFDETETAPTPMMRRADGSLVVSGAMPADEFRDRLGLTLAPATDYDTVAGLVLAQSGDLPAEGQVIEIGAWRIEIMDMDGRRIDKILVTPTG